MTDQSNIIYLKWHNKKMFPKGDWLKEPDICQWEYNNFACLALRDMSLGIWKGFVGLDTTHKLYSKSLEDLIKTDDIIEICFSVHGGLCSAGPLISKYKSYNNNLWWLGIETATGGDLMPLLKLDMENPDIARTLGTQTYKGLSFIRRETNKLARCIKRII